MTELLEAGPAPPQDIEAEESVLGAMLIASGAIAACAPILSQDDFYRHTHGLLYSEILRLYDRGTPVDAITVADALAETPAPFGQEGSMLEAVGGRVRIHELAALVPATANAAHYARIVRDAATLRGLIRAGQEIARLGWDRPGEIRNLVEQAEDEIFRLADRRASTFGLRPAAEMVRRMVARVEELHERGSHVTGTPTGFQALDNILAGYQRGNLIVIGARPSMGKSQFLVDSAAHIGVGLGLPVLIFTLEMSEHEVGQRLVASVGLIESHRLRNGSLDAAGWRSLHHAAGKIAAAPIFIDDTGDITMTEIRSRCRRFKVKHPDLALVAIDYLQLMGGSGDLRQRVQEVSQISRSMKVLSKELDVPVVALSQLSRGVESRHDKRPLLSDLRESGSIEQDADVVLFLYRDEYYNPEDAVTDGTAGVCEVNVAKHRNGPTEVTKLSFVRRYPRFSDMPLPGVVGAT